MTAPSHEAELIRQVIRGDAGAWFETHGKIWPKDRESGLITPRQNYLQRLVQAVIQRCEDKDLPVRILGLKPRQRGSSTYFTAVGYTQLRRSSTSGCVIGGQYSQTDELWKMYQTYQNHDQFDGWGNTGKVDEEKGEWSNGSRLKKETAGDALAGIAGTYQFLHCTETARWSKLGVKAAGKVLSNILKCVPLKPGTCVILESTAEGDTGEFPSRWRRSVDAEDFLNGTAAIQPGQYVRIFAPWFEFADSVMHLTPAQEDEIKRTIDQDPEYSGENGTAERDLIAAYGVVDCHNVTRLGTSLTDCTVWGQLAWRRWAIAEECERDWRIFDRDYPHSWEDAFQKTGTSRFNARGIREMRKRAASHIAEWGVLEDTRPDMTFPSWRPTSEDEAVFGCWERPRSGYRYLVSIDTMTGASQVAGLDPDCHSVTVWRKGYWEPGPSGLRHRWHRHAMVARIKWPCRWDIDVLERQVWRLACWFGGGFSCMIVPEMNMERGLVELLKLRGAVIYQRQHFNQREQRETNALGWLTTPGNREGLVDAVAAAIREFDKDERGMDVWDTHALDEFAGFIRKENGRTEAGEGFKDDDVLGTGIALVNIEHATPCAEAQSAARGTVDRILKKDGFRLAGSGLERARARKRW